MIKPSQLRQLSKSIKGKKDTEERGYFAVIGKKDGTVSTDIPGIIWVTVIATGQEIQVINRRYVPNRRGVVVFIGSDKQSANKTEVLYMLNTDGGTNGGVPTVISTVPPHNHSWPGENTTYVYGEQIMWLLAKPIAGTLTIQIYPGLLRNSTDDGFVYLVDQIVDVSGDVPASDALWITLQANDDGSVDYVVGSVNVARASLDEGDIPEPTTGRAIWAVILEAGRNELFQNAVVNDFLDLRFDSHNALDADLVALANLISAANKIPYFTGSGTAGLLDFKDEDNMASNSASALASQQSIKAYVDAAIIAGGGIGTDGWISYSTVTPTRASADDPTYVLTFASVDITDKISVGMRLKWTQNSTVRYGIVTAIAFSTNTTLTLYGGTDYDVDDTGTYTISDFYYSPVKTPLGFPTSPSYWTHSVSDTNICAKASPTANVWYGDTGLSSTGPSLAVPIGNWVLGYNAISQMGRGGATVGDLKATLSTASNSESDSDFTDYFYDYSGQGLMQKLSKAKILALASKTTYYLNLLTTQASASFIQTRGDVSATKIFAICAYL